MTHIIDYKTKIIFGKNSLNKLPELIREYNATKVLIIYGGGSIKRNGIYQQVIELLENNNIQYGEFSGIEPNPRHTTIDKASNMIKQDNYDFVLAIGGGSVIDATKVIIAGASHEWETCWDLITGKVKIENKLINFGAIITLAGTASENNGGSVVTNLESKEKYAVQTKAPVFAIENPEFTYTVNQWQTSSGAFDNFSHLLEQYYGADDFDYTDNITFAMLKTLIKNVPLALENPNNYSARENLLITSSFSLNRVIHFKNAEIGSDWLVHSMEHAISAVWDVTHGAGLALITPYYIKYAMNKNARFKEKTAKLGLDVFGVSSAEETVVKIEEIIELWNLPRKYSDFSEIKNITEEQFDKLVAHTKHGGALKLVSSEIKEIFKSIKM